jgi:maltose alpha-D-glucosyltransferase/alpha-amylase
LIALRASELALKGYSDFIPVYAKENTYPFIFIRKNGNEVILAVFNPANRTEKVQFALNIKAKGYTLLAGDKIKVAQNDETYTMEAPAISYALYKLKL